MTNAHKNRYIHTDRETEPNQEHRGEEAVQEHNSNILNSVLLKGV